ncbi:MAG TPA: DUF4440 domain-containing protein [Bacillales bacterium]|nr:DUF4440 domain-containing protein [Bacillales bacterium]
MDVHKTFVEMHNDYFEKWEHAMKSGDTSELEKLMPDDYYVTFFMRDQEKPTFFDRTEAVEGMRQSVSSHSGETKRFEHRVIRVRDTEHAVVFYEQIIEKNNEEWARLFTIEDWRNRDGHWEMAREVQEPI